MFIARQAYKIFDASKRSNDGAQGAKLLPEAIVGTYIHTFIIIGFLFYRIAA